MTQFENRRPPTPAADSHPRTTSPSQTVRRHSPTHPATVPTLLASHSGRPPRPPQCKMFHVEHSHLAGPQSPSRQRPAKGRELRCETSPPRRRPRASRDQPTPAAPGPKPLRRRKTESGPPRSRRPSARSLLSGANSMKYPCFRPRPESVEAVAERCGLQSRETGSASVSLNFAIEKLVQLLRNQVLRPLRFSPGEAVHLSAPSSE